MAGQIVINRSLRSVQGEISELERLAQDCVALSARIRKMVLRRKEEVSGEMTRDIFEGEGT